MKKKISIAVLFSFIPVLTQAFSDVSVLNPLYTHISYVAEKGILKGYADGTFGTDKIINRAEALKSILTSTEEEIPEVGDRKFSDVPADTWFAKYVNHATSMGIVSGDAQTGMFSPAREVNRAEFMKMIIKAFDIDPAKFIYTAEINDISEGAWFGPYLNFAVKFKIITLSDGNVFPGKSVSRGEAADLIFKTLQAGGGLRPQILINLIEEHLVQTMRLLEEKKTSAAGLMVSMAEKFSRLAITVSSDNVVVAADKTVQAVKSLVAAYTAGEKGQIEAIITESKAAWVSADEAGRLNPEHPEMAESIKHLAHQLADKAREVKQQLEESGVKIMDGPPEGFEQ